MLESVISSLARHIQLHLELLVNTGSKEPTDHFIPGESGGLCSGHGWRGVIREKELGSELGTGLGAGWHLSAHAGAPDLENLQLCPLT